MPSIVRDAWMSVRRFRRKPLFFLGACALLAIAAGANTAIFAVINAVMLRPLPLRQADHVVALHVVRDGTSRGAFSLPMFLDLSAARQTLDDVAAYFQWSANLTDSGEAERLQAMRVTDNYFQVLGAGVALGRTLTKGDAGPAGASVIVISDGLWKRRFGGSPEVVGRSLRLNGEAFTIVGILRPDFTFQIREAELIAAWTPEQDPRRANPTLGFLRVVGRLAATSGISQAHAELETRITEFRSKYPAAAALDKGGRVVALREDIVGSNGRLLVMLAGAVALVLLIATANLTNLLLVNGAARLSEFATRRALGASRRQLVAQLLTETLVLAAAGGLVGLAFARLAISALLAASGAVVPRAAEVTLDWTAVVFGLLLAVVVAVIAAVLPALQLSFVVSRGVTGQRSVTLGGRKLRALFVCTEVALSVLLVVGAGLLVRSFAALQRVEPGFQPSGVLSIRLSLPRNRYKATGDVAGFYERLAPRIRSVPGVSGAAAANVVPMNGYLATATIQVPGFEEQATRDLPDVHYRMISPDYYAVMGIPVVMGRAFTDADDAAGMPVAIVSQGLAKRYWRDQSPIGAQIKLRDDNNAFRDVQVIGVVGDVRHFGLETEHPRELYVPIPQVPNATSVWLANNMYWVVKTSGSPLSYANAFRREVAAVDADVAASFIRTMDQWLEQSVETRRFNLRVIAVFAVTALLLAGIGVYGVAAEAVAVRTREIGVRSALGATDSQLTTLIMRGGIGPVLGGVALGTSGALVMAKTLTSFVYGVTTYDPFTFLTVIVVVIAVGTVALYVPARRVMRVDPVIALRTE